jgi:hypothetical protein
MSDLLTHWAVFEDLRRIAALDPAVDPLFASILQEEREFARLGAISRGGRKFVPHILKDARQAWDSAADPALLRRKLAYALGGVTHFPTDYVLKPLMSELAQADWSSTHTLAQERDAAQDILKNLTTLQEISVYYDVHVFRQVYLSGQEEPFSRFLMLDPSQTTLGQALAQFITTLFQRALLSSHTLDPDFDDFDAWLENLIDKVQPLYLDVQLYASVFENPDPRKMERYQVESAFYRMSDPLISLAQSLLHGDSIEPGALNAAMLEGANQSGYARTLELGVHALRGASSFWRGETPEPPDLKQGYRWTPKPATQD